MRVGFPETKRNHAPAPALRHRQRNQVAHEIDYVPEVAVEPDPVDGIGCKWSCSPPDSA
jgi:hypothetical protein